MVDVYGVLLISTLNALHGLLQFYAADFDELNVDGLFGLRIIEGQLKHIYADFELGKHRHIPKEIMKDIKSLSVNASKIANTALPYVFDQDPTYFQKFKYLVHQPWTITNVHRLTEPRLEWPNRLRKLHVMTENETDECIGELLSSAASVAEDWAQDVKNQNPEQFGCKKLTKICLNKMLNQKGLTGYELTHQVLYTNVAELVDCLPVVEDYLKEIGYENGAIAFYVEYCSNLLHDIEKLVTRANGIEYLSSYNQDLAMEIQFACGQLGFVEFTRRAWLEALLSWQDVTGCYKHHTHTKHRQQETDDNNNPTMRKLMREKVLENDCASHKSAVAAGALSVYLRFLVDPGSGEIRYLRLDAQPSGNDALELPMTHFWKDPPIDFNALIIKGGGERVGPRRPSELEFELISPPPLLRTDRTLFAFVIIVVLFSMFTYKVCHSRSMRSWKYKVLKY